MARTILFFGDSNTRGYGVGRQARFAACVEMALAGKGGWQCAVSQAPSDFRSFARRIDHAISSHAPDVLVWQCPTGPAAYFIRYPKWIMRLASLHNRVFEWLRERHIGADMRSGGDGRTRREALYEGLYLQRLYGRRPSRWLGVRQLRRLLAARYGTRVKATRERYLELAGEARDHLRATTRAPVVFLGILPHDDEYFPGYTARATEFNEHLARLLHRPEDGLYFVEALSIVDGQVGVVMLDDGMHLTVEGHRRVAARILPTLEKLALEIAAERSG